MLKDVNELAMRVQQYGDMKECTLLYSKVKNYIHSYVYKKCSKFLECYKEDFVSNAKIGFMYAIKSYDIKKGSFITHLTFYMLRYIFLNIGIIKTVSYVNSINSTVSIIKKENKNRNMIDYEKPKTMGINRYNQGMSFIFGIEVSFNSKNNDTSYELIDCFSNGYDLFEEAELKISKERFENKIKNCNTFSKIKKDRIVFIYTTLLKGFTIKEIAKNLKVSEVYVRRLIKELKLLYVK